MTEWRRLTLWFVLYIVLFESLHLNSCHIAQVEAYEMLTDGSVLGDGGFLVKAAQNAATSLVCPSGISPWNADNVAMGNLSILNLGAIEIYEVIFGNVEGDNQCNSSSAYGALTDLCQFGSSCCFTAGIFLLTPYSLSVNHLMSWPI